MKVDVAAVEKATKALEAAYKARDEAVNDLAKVRAMGGQQGYSVTVNGVRVQVAAMDEFYNGKLIRGREMIHLGALKALQGNVDHFECEVWRKERALAALTHQEPHND